MSNTAAATRMVGTALLIRALLMQNYWKLLLAFESWQRQQPGWDTSIQATMLMVLPSTCQDGFMRKSGLIHDPHPCCLDQGVGYSRLCCQLVAYGSNLQNIWLLDDNIEQCFELDFMQVLAKESTYHHEETLKCVTLGGAMQKLEKAVLNQQTWKVGAERCCKIVLLCQSVMKLKLSLQIVLDFNISNMCLFQVAWHELEKEFAESKAANIQNRPGEADDSPRKKYKNCKVG